MTDLERRATKALGGCSFLPGIATKRFAHGMAAKPDDYVLSERQKAFLWRACWTFRRQLPAEIVAVATAEREKNPRPDLDVKSATLKL